MSSADWKRWKAANPERHKAYRRAWYHANKDRLKPHVKAYHDRVKPRLKELWTKYYKEHREQLLDGYKARRRAIRLAVIEAYGGRCQCPGGCGVAEPDFLTIDHIDGRRDGGAPRGSYRLYAWLASRGFPKDNYRLLCCNCNLSRGWLGSCPHERK